MINMDTTELKSFRYKLEKDFLLQNTANKIMMIDNDDDVMTTTAMIIMMITCINKFLLRNCYLRLCSVYPCVSASSSDNKQTDR